MRKYSIHDAVKASGLSRGQIDQLISRWGLTLWERPELGKPRRFHPADIFTLCVAGELHRMGLDMPTIRTRLATMDLAQLDAEGMPVEMYTGQREARAKEPLIVFWENDARIIPADKLSQALRSYGDTALVVNARAIEKRFAELVEGSGEIEQKNTNPLTKT